MSAIRIDVGSFLSRHLLYQKANDHELATTFPPSLLRSGPIFRFNKRGLGSSVLLSGRSRMGHSGTS